MSATHATSTPSDRVLLWRWLAAAFTYPDAETWAWLTDENVVRAVTAPRFSGTGPDKTVAPTGSLAEAQSAYLRIFGHTVKGDCPPHELEYGELKADPLFQPHRLADIAAFYNAFGLEVAPDADERVDHIAMECEFYAVLCAKEAVAAAEQIEFCRQTQKKFLQDHLARWTPAFSRRVERLAGHQFYRLAARLLREAVEAECARHGIAAGNADLQLRPREALVDPCGACGLATNPHE
jgi:DMSO reductase family type II enzyme chaperone